MSSAANRNNRNHIRSIKQKAHRASDQTNDAGEEDGKRDDSNDVVAAVAPRSLMKRVRRSPATTIAYCQMVSRCLRRYRSHAISCLKARRTTNRYERTNERTLTIGTNFKRKIPIPLNRFKRRNNHFARFESMQLSMRNASVCCHFANDVFKHSQFDCCAIPDCAHATNEIFQIL